MIKYICLLCCSIRYIMYRIHSLNTRALSVIFHIYSPIVFFLENFGKRKRTKKDWACRTTSGITEYMYREIFFKNCVKEEYFGHRVTQLMSHKSSSIKAPWVKPRSDHNDLIIADSIA